MDRVLVFIACIACVQNILDRDTMISFFGWPIPHWVALLSAFFWLVFGGAVLWRGVP